MTSLRCYTIYIIIGIAFLSLHVPSIHLNTLVNTQKSDSSSPCRRALLFSLSSSLALLPSPSQAGELGSKVNAMVTKSDLGVSVRRDVVAGAQFMDKLDGRWERFSDKNGLGSARKRQNKAQPFPEMEPPPPLKELDARYLKEVLEVSDRAFLAASGLSPDKLDQEKTRVSSLTAKVRSEGGAKRRPKYHIPLALTRGARGERSDAPNTPSRSHSLSLRSDVPSKRPSRHRGL